MRVVGGSSEPIGLMITVRQLLRQHIAPFTVAFLMFTGSLVANYALRRFPQLGAGGASAGTFLELVLLSVPFVVAMTLPMAVFLAVLWVFTRLGADDTVAEARRAPGGVRRLINPVLGVAAGIAVLAMIWNAEILPRANHRLSTIVTGNAGARSDRAMTIGELRAAAQTARASAQPGAERQVARFEVELQKKFALAASIVVLALTGMALGLVFPRAGVLLMIGASFAVFGAYYFALTTGETLVNRLAVSPFVGMWTANALFFAVSLVAVWWSGRRRAPRRAEGLALG
jgi:lipopolysaccharide export LptBFGC system permease protein LptF